MPNINKIIHTVITNPQVAEKFAKYYDLFKQEVANGRKDLTDASSELTNAMAEVGYLNFEDIIKFVTNIEANNTNTETQ